MIDRRWATAIFTVTITLSGIALTLLAATWSDPVNLAWGFRGYSIILALCSGIVGLVLSIRVPANRVGWLVAVIGLMSGLQAITDEYALVGLTIAPGSLPVPWLAGWLSAWIWVLPLALGAIGLPLVFPSGRLTLTSDRRIGWFALLAVAVSSVGLAIAPGANASVPSLANPLHLPLDEATLTVLNGMSYPPLGLAAMLSAASLVRRFRRSRGDTRQQLKWFAFAVSGVGLAVGTGLILGAALEGPWRAVSALAIIATFVGLIAAIGIAVLRYRLYDIDRIVSRSISYAAVTAVLVAAYASVVLLLQGPLGSITGGDTIQVALSTLVVAAMFNPLRRRVQTIVDRRFNRARFDAERTSSAFAGRLREQVDLPTLAAELDDTVRQAIAPSTVALWLRGDRQ